MIRKLTLNDIEPYWILRLRALKEYPESFGGSYEEAIKTPLDSIRERFTLTNDNFILGAFNDLNELIGMVGFKQETSKKMRHKGIIWGMYVRPDYQGRGIGKRMLLEVIKNTRELEGLEQINLFVVRSNKSAMKLYKTIGFETYGIERNALKLEDNHYIDEELMVYKLI